jgi:hypothetical protein
VVGKGLVRVFRILGRKWFFLFMRFDGNEVEVVEQRSGFRRNL